MPRADISGNINDCNDDVTINSADSIQSDSDGVVKQAEINKISKIEEKLLFSNFPRLVQFGSANCPPCRQMDKILDELRNEYKGKFDVIYIDIDKQRDTARNNKIKYTPTQIYFDSSGNEIFRHIGYIDKKSLLENWKNLEFSFNEQSD